MKTRKNALIFFTKVPTPGMTKTRLTKDAGGIFTPEEAANFYHAVMLDTAEVGFRALEKLQNEQSTEKPDETKAYVFFVCAAPASDHPRLKEILSDLGDRVVPTHYIADQGRNFNEHFNDAFQQVFQLGYDSAVAIGGDQPQMTTTNIIQAFRWLEHFADTYHGSGLVYCPCQACGVSLVGLNKKTPMDFEGVFYNMDGVSALDAIIDICNEKKIPVAALETVADIDNTEDLAHALSMAHSQRYTSRYQHHVVVPERFLAWAEKNGLIVCTPPNTNHDPRRLLNA
jgi:glycosyltransferase A (GT-A) superfamily protein (DUF2064 family)